MGPVNTMGQDSLERAVREAGIDVPPVWLDEVGSTNDEARRLAREGAPEWTVVAAGHQTAGRGRLGRSWVDAHGSALLFSTILRPDLPPDRAPLVSLLAVWAMCGAVGVGSARAKWPNDVVVRGRKLAGILPEARITGGQVEHLVLGIGVNVAMGEGDFPLDVRGAATSVLLEGGEADLARLLTRFLVPFRRASGEWDEVVPRYREVCATIGRRVRATTTAGDVIEGTAANLTLDGGLVVDANGRSHIVAFGEVAHLE